MSSLAAATKPALKSRESPGRKKPKSNPVSIKIIPATTTYNKKGATGDNCSSNEAAKLSINSN
jgi:hypothetical protein